MAGAKDARSALARLAVLGEVRGALGALGSHDNPSSNHRVLSQFRHSTHIPRGLSDPITDLRRVAQRSETARRRGFGDKSASVWASRARFVLTTHANSVQRVSSPDDRRGTTRSLNSASRSRCTGITLSGTFSTRSATPIITVATTIASACPLCRACGAWFRSSNRAHWFRCVVVTDWFLTHRRSFSRSGFPSASASPTSRPVLQFRAPGVTARASSAILRRDAGLHGAHGFGHWRHPFPSHGTVYKTQSTPLLFELKGEDLRPELCKACRTNGFRSRRGLAGTAQFG